MSTAQAIPFSFDEKSHVCWDEHGKVIPSVTQILTEMNYSNYAIVEQTNPVALERKRQIGKLVHKLCHFLDDGTLDEQRCVKLTDDDDELRPLREHPVLFRRVDAYRNFKLDTGYVPLINESRHIFDMFGMRYTGQFDSIGMIRNRWAIVDIKNASGAGQRSWGLQEIAYEEGVKGLIRAGRFSVGVPLTPEQYRGILSAPLLRIIPQLFDDGTYKLYTSEDPKSKVFFPEDLRVWQSALCIVLDKRNHESR
jgi:hypothetical protein